jgi:hypothetical protein
MIYTEYSYLSFAASQSCIDAENVANLASSSMPSMTESWPLVYRLPKFSTDVTNHLKELQKGNFRDGLVSPAVKREILHTIFEDVKKYTM